MQGYLQITYLEPYFDEWENRQRTTVYDKYFNISKSLHFTSCDYDDVLAISNDAIFYRTVFIQHPFHSWGQSARGRHGSVHAQDDPHFNGMLSLCQTKERNRQTRIGTSTRNN